MRPEYDHYIAVDWSSRNMAIARMTGKTNKISIVDVSAEVGELKVKNSGDTVHNSSGMIRNRHLTVSYFFETLLFIKGIVFRLFWHGMCIANLHGTIGTDCKN